MRLEYKISKGELGVRAVEVEGRTPQVLVRDPDAKVFVRRALKTKMRLPGSVEQSALVVELKGVRVYLSEGILVVTEEDLYL